MCEIWIGVRMSYCDGLQRRVVVDENGILNHENMQSLICHSVRTTHTTHTSVLNESTRQMKLSVVTILHYGYLISCYLSA
jgi:hypothetical protein